MLILDVSPTCWQSIPGESASEETRYLALQHVLKLAVDKIFQTLAPTCPDLLAIIMNVTGEFGYDLRYKPSWPPAFIRSKQTDPFGRAMYVGAPIDAHMIKDYEPCFDLLDPPAFIYD